MVLLAAGALVDVVQTGVGHHIWTGVHQRGGPGVAEKGGEWKFRWNDLRKLAIVKYRKKKGTAVRVQSVA